MSRTRYLACGLASIACALLCKERRLSSRGLRCCRLAFLPDRSDLVASNDTRSRDETGNHYAVFDQTLVQPLEARQHQNCPACDRVRGWCNRRADRNCPACFTRAGVCSDTGGPRDSRHGVCVGAPVAQKSSPNCERRCLRSEVNVNSRSCVIESSRRARETRRQRCRTLTASLQAVLSKDALRTAHATAGSKPESTTSAEAV